MFKLFTLLLVLPLAVLGQQAGTLTPETHPQLSWSQCTKAGSCTSKHGEVVIDANWRWVHNAQGQNCYTGNKWDATSCPDDKTCAQNCALDGAQYQSTYGVSSAGNALTLKFVTQSQNKNIGSRLYLMASESKYQMFHLLNQEFTFDVDVSKLPCGLNGALYLVSMEEDGGSAKHPTNKAGAKYGTGYCDSQCPRDIKFINGEANPEGWVGTTVNSGNGKHGSCCAEMDIWEANSMATAFTPHPCSTNALHMCEGDACGGATGNRYAGTCDPDGCDFNSYRQGNTSFYGPGKTVDTTKMITVVTQFITSDNTATGTLHEIRRFYVQGGKVIPNSQSTVAGTHGNSITQEWCAAQKKAFSDRDSFTQHGGLKQMGEALKAGMVLVLSLWDDYAVDMLWLDAVAYPKDASPTKPGVARGPCALSTGVPAEVEASTPNAQVVYSNIRVGPINSTFTH